MSTKNIQTVLANLRNRKSTTKQQVENARKTAISNVMNSIRNKDAVHQIAQQQRPKETTRSVLSRIMQIGENNPEYASDLYSRFNAMRQDKKSNLYDPYTESTHSSIQKLKDWGYDVSNINDKWFNDNAWYKDYLHLNEYTNNASKPDYRRASQEEKAAYEIFRLKQGWEDTKKAKQEQEELEQYLREAATSKGRTQRDDEIVKGINWNKYPTLKKMRQYASNGAPMALTEGVSGSSDDWAYGVLWSALNNGGTGDSESDIANAYAQRGNTFSRNQYKDRQAQKKRQETAAILDEINKKGSPILGGTMPGITNRNALLGVKPGGNSRQALAEAQAQQRQTLAEEQAQAKKKQALASTLDGINRNSSPILGGTMPGVVNRNALMGVTPRQASRNWLAQNKATPDEQEQLREQMETQRAQAMQFAEQQKRIASMRGDPTALRYGGQLSGWSNDVKNAMLLENAEKRIRDREGWIAGGQGNEGSDYSTYNREGLNAERQKFQTELDSINKTLDGLRAKKEENERWQADYGGFESVFDFVADWDENNERNVLNRGDITEDQRANAQGTLDDLTNTREERRNASIIRAQDFQLMNGEATNYQQTPEAQAALRKQAFNEMMGDFDAYDRYAEKLPAEAMEELDRRLDAALGQIDNPNDNRDNILDSQISEGERRASYFRDKIGRVDSQLKVMDDYDALMKGDGTQGDGTFRPENEVISEDPIKQAFDAGGVADVDRYNILYNIWNPSVDTIYSFINHGEAYQDWMKVSGNVPDGMKNVALMNDKEINKFNEYYNAGKKAEAMSFVEGLQTALSQRYRYYEDIEADYLAHTAPVISSAVSVATTLVQPLEMLAAIGGKIFGDKQADNPDSGFYSETRFKNKIREYVGDQMSDTGKFFYDAAMSAGDSFINVMAGQGMDLTDKALEAGTLALFGTEAFQTSMEQNLRETNGNWGYSFVESTIDALIETATEVWSVENVLSDPKNFLQYLFKASFSEGSEEFVGAAFGPLIKQMLGRKNEWNERATQILGEGGYTDAEGNWVAVDNEVDAERQALREWNHDIITSTLSGAVSTGGGIFVGGARNLSDRAFGQYREAGKQIRKAETGGETTGQQVLLDAALGMKEDTKSNQQAQKLRERLKEGKKISDFQLGKLARNIYSETNESAAKAAQSIVEDKAFEKLEGSGLEGEERRQMAQVMAEAVVKGGVDNISKESKHKLLGNTAAFNIYKDFMFDSETSQETMGAIVDATQRQAETQRSVSELMNADLNRRTQDTGSVGEQMATEDDIRQATGTRTEGSRGVIVDGQWAKLGDQVIVIEGEGKNAKSSLKWQVTVNGEKRTVNASQIRAADFGTAAIIRQAAVNPGMFSRGFTNTLIAANENGQIKNVGRYLVDAQNIRLAAYTGMQMPSHTIGSEAAQTIYDQAKWEHQHNRQNDVIGRNAEKPGTTSVTFQGAEYGTDEWDRTLNEKVKSENQRKQMNAIAGIAKRAGITVTFRTAAETRNVLGIKESEQDQYYGWEKREGIGINVEGLDFMLDENGKEAARGSHHMLVTFGHEMTHWLQRNSMQGYNRLESFVLGEMRANGVNVNRRIREVMGQQNLSIEDAISEIVADSCDQILANESVQKHIAETDEGLFKQIKGFVKELVNRVKAAVSGMDQSMSRDARAMINSTNRLAKVWLGAYDEALSGMTSTGTDTADKTRFSVKSLPDGTKYVLVDNPAFGGRTNVSLDEVRDFLKDHIGDYYPIIESGQKVYLGKQTAKEYAFSGNTRMLQKKNLDAYTSKINALGNIGEIIGNATNREHQKAEHAGASKAKYGVYKYTSTFAFRLKNGYKAYDAELYILNFSDGQKKLYDLVVKDENTALEQHLDKKASLSKAVSSEKKISQKQTPVKQTDQDNDQNKAKFSMAKPVEGTRDLIAVHNLEADQLMKVLQLGGFPMPSIAIIRDNYAHNRYGGVSVLFNKETIDPNFFRTNKVYSGDAWTPTYPSVEYKLNEKEFKNIRKRIENLVSKDIMRNLQYQGFDETNMQRDLNSFGGDVVTAFGDKLLYQMAYLADKGENIQYPMKEQKLDRMGNFTNSQVIMVKDLLGEDAVQQAYSEGYRYIQEHPEIVEQIRQALNKQFREEHKGSKLKLLQRDLYSQDNFGMNKVYSLISAAGIYLNTGIQEEVDESALKEQVKNRINKEEFDAWLRDFFSGIIEKSGLRNNKDYYTNSGNPRSWEALHDEETLENVVRIMKEQSSKGEAAFFNQSALLALGTRDFKSVEDIRKHKDQLRHMTDEEMSAAKTEIINKVSAIQEEIRDRSERNDFIARDRALQAIAEAVRRGKTVQVINKELRQWRGLNIHEDTAQKIADVMKEIADLPTEYFEAKPQRAVGLDEIAKVILPADTDQNLIDALDKNGIQYETYDGTDEDRLRVMNRQEDIKFSKTITSEDERTLAESGEITAEPARYSYAGINAGGGFAKAVSEAMRMEKEGVPESEIMEKTGCVKGFRGRWWKVLDNGQMHFNTQGNVESRREIYNLGDIYDARELYEAYPALKSAYVKFVDMNGQAMGKQHGNRYSQTIEIKKDLLNWENSTEVIESVLQHEIQHAIQSIEGSEQGASETFWKDMQDIARARMHMDEKYLQEIYDKYQLKEEELPFGIEFNEDGTVDEEMLWPEALEKVRQMNEEELHKVKIYQQDAEKYMKLLRTGPLSLYWDTVGEIEARAAGERKGSEQYNKINYGPSPVAVEDYIGRDRYSRATSESLDVGAWMMAQTPGSFQTEDERALWQAYKDLRIRISLSIKRQLDYKADIARMEKREADLTPAEREDLETLRKKLEIQQQRQAELEDELYRVTSSEGYAGMMYHNNIVLKDFILGKTQDEVREAVEQMVDAVKATEREIQRQVKAMQKLADSTAVKAVASMIERKSLNYAVTSLQREMNTAMGKTELESRLIEMALKRANGEDITEDARTLAIDMTNKMRGYQMETLERMRGVTITIGPDQRAEMKGNGMTLASVREQLKGTGIKVRYGDYSSLETDTGEGGDLRTILPELPDDIGENSGDALFKFISWAQSVRDTEMAARQEMVDIEDATMSVLAIAGTINVKLNSPEYRRQNEGAMKIRQMATDLQNSGKTMMENTDLAGKRAVGMASVLQRDVHEAIKYYNTIAQKAALEEKNKVRKNIIDQLKSQHTVDLIKQQRKYEEMMKNDRKARELAEDNLQIRNRINTVASRVRKRLMEETDQKNIPEEAKALARQVLGMLVKHDYVGYRHVLFADKKSREATMRALDSWNKRDGEFKEEDLDWLIVGSGENADYEVRDHVVKDLIDIEQGLLEYRTAEGQRHITLMDRKTALKKIDKAVTEIWNIISAREKANISGKSMLISELALQARDDMQHSRFKGELTGKIGHGLAKVKGFVVNGNTTPEYFFKNLRNGTLSQLYDEYHRAENRNGLEVGKAQRRIAEIAEKYGYGTWDQKKRYVFKLEKGGEVSLTLGEMMSLYATWQRELRNQLETNGPEQSFHLTVGGFYTAQEEKAKILGREIVRQKAHRLTGADMAAITGRMTEEQLGYVEDMVKYLSRDMSDLGNEASMRMYGIKKYKEEWYFPFEIWNGVKSKKSDQGAAGNTENRVAHSSFSKRRVNNASNALVIRDFTETAVKHIGQMINYNTFAPAIEFMNRVMNHQVTEPGEGENSDTKRNLRAIFAEMYGKEAIDYFDNFQKDINGGVTRAEQTIADKLLSTFKKGAVAGSVSVALQQPLSYIRAAMLVNPKYLAAAISPAYYKGSQAEMEKYSGVAVIKSMGKFDMNFGQSAQDYMMPDAKESVGRAVYGKISDITTALPELMDRMTWTRMWTACKLEQQALNPEMDHKSDEFLNKVAERFNDVMRKTQVYDSILVKSRNMRSQHWWMKGITSFMAEPTMTANVLADAVANVKEKGGKAMLAKAGTTFVLSAILQAVVKGIIGAGRNPQDKKTWDENVAYRFASNFIGEVNPLSLIPGYSDMMELLINGELKDDAMGVVGKIMDAVDAGGKWIRGESGSTYRYVEDSIGQLAQLFTNIPAKNLMRDARAMWNYIVDQPYAKRENSKAVLQYQLLDLLHNSQNLTGVINQKVLGEKGWETKNAAYFSRIYEADKAGKQQKVNDMIEYLTLGRGTKQATINEGIRKLAKADESLTAQQKLEKQKEYGLTKTSDYITTEYEEGRLSRKEAEEMYRKEHPEADNKKVMETFDRIDYKKAGKLEKDEHYSSYNLLYDAIEANSQADIRKTVKLMISYGYKKENIKKQLTTKYKQDYIDADQNGRRQLQNRLTKAYTEIGLTSQEAFEIMQKWVLDENRKKSKGT